MSVRVRLALFLLGLGLAGGVVAHIGVDTLLEHLKATGWLLFPVVLIWGVVYTLSAAAWYTLLGIEPGAPGYARTWVLNVSSFALNWVMPAAGLGGEGYRVVAISPWIGQQRAVGSVVQYRLLHSLAHMIFILVALIPGIFLLPRTAPVSALLAVTAAVGFGIAWFLHRRHQEGILEAGLDLLLAIPGVRRLARRLETKRRTLRELDAQITTMYHQHPRRFWRALLLEFLSRCVMALELAVILWGVGLGIRLPEAFVTSALSTALFNLLFFLPFELGSREGGLFLVFSLLGLGAAHGVFAAVVQRLRELTWAGIGLGLLWVSGERLPSRVEQADGERAGVGGGATPP